jgi:hypothetical protein
LATKAWTFELHDDFEPEYRALPPNVQIEFLAAADAVETLGPVASEPEVKTLRDSKHANMKELRFKAANGTQIWRAAFAFDPAQQCVFLVAGEKQGIDEKMFYKRLIKKADKRYDTHLEAVKKALEEKENAERAAQKAADKAAQKARDAEAKSGKGKRKK